VLLLNLFGQIVAHFFLLLLEFVLPSLFLLGVSLGLVLNVFEHLLVLGADLFLLVFDDGICEGAHNLLDLVLPLFLFGVPLFLELLLEPEVLVLEPDILLLLLLGLLLEPGLVGVVLDHDLLEPLAFLLLALLELPFLGGELLLDLGDEQLVELLLLLVLLLPALVLVLDLLVAHLLLELDLALLLGLLLVLALVVVDDLLLLQLCVGLLLVPLECLAPLLLLELAVELHLHLLLELLLADALQLLLLLEELGVELDERGPLVLLVALHVVHRLLPHRAAGVRVLGAAARLARFLASLVLLVCPPGLAPLHWGRLPSLLLRLLLLLGLGGAHALLVELGSFGGLDVGDRIAHAGLEGFEGVLRDLLLGEVVGHQLLDDVLRSLALPEVLHEFPHNHLPQLLALLDGLRLFDS
jgi:hypothetical protein